jgi:gas vesicle protein
MSYAGPSRSQPVNPSSTAPGSRRATGPVPRRGADDTHETDWQQVALFGAGLALGIALGAGIAMLTAPQSGEETRADLRRFATRKRRALGRRSNEAWLDLRAELRGAKRALARRKAQRAAEREAADHLG